MRLPHALLLVALPSIAAGQSGPSLDAFPFDEWIKSGHSDAHISWSLRTSRPLLSESQRLIVAVSAEVKQPIPPQLFVMMQIRDRDQHTYRSRLSSGRFRGRGSRPASPGAMVWSDRVFVTPGDYDIVVALYNTATTEHSVKRTRLHVRALKNDPLPDSWRDAPGVLASRSMESLPKLWLPIDTGRPVHLEVILNQPVGGDQTGNLLARLEVLSQMTVVNGSIGVRVLDLAHRRVMFSEERGARLDMRRVGQLLDAPDPRIVRADVLTKYQQAAEFLGEHVRQALSGSALPEAAHVVIVLSAPWAFPADAQTVVLQRAPPSSSVFYVRCNSPLHYKYGPAPPVNPGRREDPSESLPLAQSDGKVDNADSLAATLKLLPARVFDVTTAADFRRVLRTIVREISQTN